MQKLIRQVKLPAYTKSDIWVLLAVVPAQVTICNYLMLGKIYFSNVTVFLLATLIFFLNMFTVFQFCGLLALRFLKIWPSISQTPLRVTVSIITFVSLTVVGIIPLNYIYERIPSFNYHSGYLMDYRVAIISGLGSMIITITFEGLAAFERWKTTLFETDQLKRENLKSQLLSLRNQVNPHFLFNNINSLSSLISEDPDKAEVFLDEMSKVYRYLLRNNEDNLVTLSMEIQFIRSYFHLLKMRYGNAIHMDIKVSDECSTCLMPPLTLQILMENAIKHNIISKEKPLYISIICNNNEQLCFTNNFQPKVNNPESEKSGLRNLASKYQLMNEPDIRVSENNESFTVTIPLIISGKAI